MHIAVAMGSNVLALFGPTSPYITGPYGDGSYRVISRFDGCAIPCYHVACNDNRCMRAITVQDVMREAEKLLKVKQIQNPNNTNTTK
jgi:ADP-heptose:LPS heptosyltransferase